MDGLVGFTNISGKWTGYGDDLVDEASTFMDGFMAEPVGLDQSSFLQGVGQAANWGVREVVKKPMLLKALIVVIRCNSGQ
ncbi:MAG: hypothetical protein U0V70_12970 [Terriglobia bacterium]